MAHHARPWPGEFCRLYRTAKWFDAVLTHYVQAFPDFHSKAKPPVLGNRPCGVLDIRMLQLSISPTGYPERPKLAM